MIDILFIELLIFSFISGLKSNFKLNRLNCMIFSISLLLMTIIKIIPQTFFQIKASYLLNEYFYFDSINTFLLIILGVIVFMIFLYVSFFRDDEKTFKTKEYTICLLAFVFSMTGAILSRHLALLWVFIEATTLSSTFLIWQKKDKASLEAAWKYLFICSIGVSLAFVGIILLSFGVQGHQSLFFDEMLKNSESYSAFWLRISFIFITIGFGTKMGLAPMHTWKADTYSQAPTHISALLATCLLNTAILPVFRMFNFMKKAGLGVFSGNLLMLMGFMSLIFSALYIIKVKNIKRMLAYSSIENAGIIMIALSATALQKGQNYSADSFIYHIVSHSFTKAAMFLCAGYIIKTYKSDVISEINGISERSKLIAFVWISGFLVLSCFPPGIAFFSEINLILAMLYNQQYIRVVLFIILTTIIIYNFGKNVVTMTFLNNNQKYSENLIKASKRLYIPFLMILSMVLLGIAIPDLINDSFSVIKNNLNLPEI